MYEVELKFPLADPQEVVARLLAWGAVRREAVDQCDVYFRHPQRDFATTDEALRVRSAGERNCVTYKGPVVDLQSKMRHEIEVPLADGLAARQQFEEMLAQLGFQPVRSVQKQRTVWCLTRQGREFEFAFDDVTGLGTFIEIETLADEAERADARDAILALAAQLELREAERKSYLCLLLERDASVGTAARR